MDPESNLQSWVLLRDRLYGLNSSLASLVGSECELEHLVILRSAKTGADIIPVLHSICSNFMAAHDSLLNSWKGILRDVIGSFDKNMKIDGMIQDLIVTTARFDSQPEAAAWPANDIFVIMINEVYARRGYYDEICDICDQILDFKHADHQYTLPLSHIELAIASIADNIIDKNIPDKHTIIDRCANILKRRANSMGIDVSFPKDNESAFRTISCSAHFFAQYRKLQNPCPWISKYSVNYPLMYDEFVQQVSAIDFSKVPTPTTEQEGSDALVSTTKKLIEARSYNMALLSNTMCLMFAYVNKNLSFDTDLQNYITEMTRFGSGAVDELPFRILVDLYIERKMYAETCSMCKEMNQFGGADKQRMVGSKLIELVMADLLRHMKNECPKVDADVVKKCRALLRTRSANLNLRRVLSGYRGDKLRQAELLAADISLRRRMRDSNDICSWISERYSLSYEFLKLDKYKDDIATTKPILATQVSDMMGFHELASTYKPIFLPATELDELETLLETMRRLNIDSNLNSSQWKKVMPASGIRDSLLEMNLYVHCKSTFDVIPHPKIGGRSCADLKVGECYVEIYSPFEKLITATNRAIRDSIPKLCDKIMIKKQIESFDEHQSILAVRFYDDTFDNPVLRQLLETRIQDRPCLGGILLILDHDDRYNTFFITNKKAKMPIPKSTVNDICSAIKSGI